MDFLLFWGRFHVLLLHLPIGILTLAILLEWLPRISRKIDTPSASWMSLIWKIGAISAVVAAILGYMLSFSGDYGEERLNLHMWLGIALALVSILKAWGGRRLNSGVISMIVLILMMATGHYGGNLTHGSTYLVEYAPDPVKRSLGFEVKSSRPRITNLDSADIYADVIQPMLDQRCKACHNPEKRKGELDLTSFAAIQEGGESGQVIKAANLTGSELYRRVTLDPEDEKYMPTDGKTPLSKRQIEIMAWWIENGVPGSGLLAEYEIKEDMREKLSDVLGLSPDAMELPLPPLEELDEEKFTELREAGFAVTPMAEGSPYLNISFLPFGRVISDTVMNVLSGVGEHVVWLNLSRSGMKDEYMAYLENFPNLMRLRLDQNEISEEGLHYLADKKYLEVLNLFGTKVDKEPEMLDTARVKIYRVSLEEKPNRES